MKYHSGQILFYVNPFIFEIEKVLIGIAIKGNQFDPKTIYYVDVETGAELPERDLWPTLEEARKDAHNKLNYFYDQKFRNITKFRPELEDLS